jgi:hypothetical protein
LVNETFSMMTAATTTKVKILLRPLHVSAFWQAISPSHVVLQQILGRTPG